MTFEEKQVISRQISIIQNRFDSLKKHGARTQIIHDDDLDVIINCVEKLRDLAKIELVSYDPRTGLFINV